MEEKQQKIVSRFGQVLTFLDTNASVIPPDKVATQRQSLETAISQIQGFAQDQVVKGTESVTAQTKSSARTALRDTYMRQVSTVGLHTLTGKNPGDPNVPNARQIFTLPATRTNSLTLLASAKAMVAAATPYAAIFSANGVSLDAVNGAIQALDSAVNAANTADRISKGATQGIKAQIKAAQGAIRLMDVVIRPFIAADKAIVTQWASVKRAAGGLNLSDPSPLPPSSNAGSTAATTTTSSSPAPATTDPSSTQSSTASTPSSATSSTSGSTTSAAQPAAPAAPAA